MKTTRRAPLLAAALALLSSGCENPFDPKADVRLWQFTGNGGRVVTVVQANALTTEQNQGSPSQSITMTLQNFGSVGAELTSYTVVYRQISAQTGSCAQPPGSPICSLGGGAGRRFSFVFYLGPVNVNTTNSTSIGMPIWPMTTELYNYIGANPATISGGIDLDITVYGTDANGHDVKVSGTLHIEIY